MTIIPFKVSIKIRRKAPRDSKDCNVVGICIVSWLAELGGNFDEGVLEGVGQVQV